MKKMTLIGFAFALMLSVFTGCSSSGTSTNPEADSGSTPADEEKGELIVGVDDKFAPMGFRDEQNELVGFDIDFARAAGEKMGYEVKFQPIDWKAKETELISGRIDLIWNGYTITDERQEKVNFTKPYLENAQVVVTQADSEIELVSDLEGKIIGLQGLSSASDALEANEVHSEVKEITEFADNVLALSDLKIGRIDAVVIDVVVANYYMSKEEGTFKVLEDSLSPELYGVGVKKENDDLLNELQTALDDLNQDGTAAEISMKWFGEDKVLK